MGHIYLLGDIHGSFKPVRSLYTYLNSRYTDRPDGSDTLILLGDLGANFFFSRRDDEFKIRLGKYPFTYFCIRGNHEERPEICAYKYPALWHQEQWNGNYVWVEDAYPYIKYANDYPSIYYITGYKTMVFPGAYSVDKYVRLAKGWSWFENEQLTFEEQQIGREMVGAEGGCDLVLSHTCPQIYEPTDLFLSVVDQNMVDKTMERYLNEIEMNLDYRLWCWGHHHATRVYPRVDGRDKVMLFNTQALDLDKYFETDNPYDALIKFGE